MTGFWNRFRRSEGGASAIEFAFVLPILAVLLLFGVDSWLRLSHAQDTAAALQTGARYYQNGGSDDAEAKTLALAAWPHKPSDAQFTVGRLCTCGGPPVACTELCSGNTPPQTNIVMSARSTFRGLHGSTYTGQQETIRVQ